MFAPGKTSVTIKDIRDVCYGGASRQHVHDQVEAGYFPRESWRTSGGRGKLVWLVETVNKYMQEKKRLTPDKNASQARINAAAIEAAEIAEQFDADLQRVGFSNHRSTRSATPGRCDNERDSTPMVA